MLVLASNSPRRRQLLELQGWAFTIRPAQIDETPRQAEDPREYVLRLAESKAGAVAAQMIGSPEALVLAADTTVASGMDILGKPADPVEAEAMLRRLRGRSHQVFTALALLRTSDGLILKDLCATEVCMRDYGDEEMLAYIASGDPLDKAGAYAIQHPGFQPVESLRGCYTNVMGLPLCRAAFLLKQLGFPPPVDLPYACLHAPQEQCSLPPDFGYAL